MRPFFGRIGSSPLLFILLGFLLILAILHTVGVLAGHYAPGSWLAYYGPGFDLDTEGNVPSVFSGFLWASSSLLTVLLALRPQGLSGRLQWLGLGTVFLYFGFDEILAVHEHIAEPIRKALSISDNSLFYHAWVIPVLIAAAGLFVIYRFVRQRPTFGKQQKAILKLLIILVIVDVVLEALGTRFYFAHPVVYKLGPVMAEELFEAGLASVVLATLASYILPPTKR